MPLKVETQYEQFPGPPCLALTLPPAQLPTISLLALKTYWCAYMSIIHYANLALLLFLLHHRSPFTHPSHSGWATGTHHTLDCLAPDSDCCWCVPWEAAVTLQWWVLATHMGDLGQIPGFWLWPGITVAIMGIWGAEELANGSLFPVSLSNTRNKYNLKSNSDILILGKVSFTLTCKSWVQIGGWYLIYPDLLSTCHRAGPRRVFWMNTGKLNNRRAPCTYWLTMGKMLTFPMPQSPHL